MEPLPICKKRFAHEMAAVQTLSGRRPVLVLRRFHHVCSDYLPWSREPLKVTMGVGIHFFKLLFMF